MAWSRRTPAEPSRDGSRSLHRAERLKRGVLVLAAGAALVGRAAPAFGMDVLCGFQARGLTMNFGALDPRTGSNATAVLSAATLNADNAGDCKQVTMTIDAQAGPRLLRNAASGDVIPYTLTGLPISGPAPGNNRYLKFTFSAVILWSAYANAPAGTYRDDVMISVTP